MVIQFLVEQLLIIRCHKKETPLIKTGFLSFFMSAICKGRYALPVTGYITYLKKGPRAVRCGGEELMNNNW